MLRAKPIESIEIIRTDEMNDLVKDLVLILQLPLILLGFVAIAV